MTHVSLFSGIGGLDLAAEWAGFESILQVEMNEYANKVLEKHWPNVKRIKDVREVNSESIDRAVTVVSGGFPCQPFSQAGKRGGTSDDRYLWPEMLRVIRALSPTWVVGENVSGLLSLNEGLEFETIATDLEEAGYEVLPLHYPAAGVGAPHRRDRVFIVAHRTGKRLQKRRQSGIHKGEKKNRTRVVEEFERCSQDVADTTDSRNVRGYRKLGITEKEHDYRTSTKDGRGQWWAIEPDVGRVASGVPNRVDRLRALGNAVVPQQAYPIFKAIAEVEKSV